MPISVAPVVTQWYRHLDRGQPFQVVALDEAEAMVEVQRFDGDVEELDLEEWYEMEVEPMDPPGDWPGNSSENPPDTLDDVEIDDPGLHISEWDGQASYGE